MKKKQDKLDKWLKDHVIYETFSFNKKYIECFGEAIKEVA